MIHNDEWRPEPEISATHQPEHGEVYEEETHAAKHQPQRGPAKRVATGPVRKLTEEEQRLRDIEKYEAHIFYSNRYYDDECEYRHVSLPKTLLKYVPQGRLLSEPEWRGLGVKQSQGWEHYMVHAPEPHILLFKREKDYQQKYPNGKPDNVEA